MKSRLKITKETTNRIVIRKGESHASIEVEDNKVNTIFVGSGYNSVVFGVEDIPVFTALADELERLEEEMQS